MTDRDALVQAVLDALNVDDLREASACVACSSTNDWLADRLDAAADALAALRKAAPDGD